MLKKRITLENSNQRAGITLSPTRNKTIEKSKPTSESKEYSNDLLRCEGDNLKL